MQQKYGLYGLATDNEVSGVCVQAPFEVAFIACRFDLTWTTGLKNLIPWGGMPWG